MSSVRGIPCANSWNEWAKIMGNGVKTFPRSISDDCAERSFYNLARARMTWALALATLGYIGLAILLPNGWLSEVMRCIQLTTSFMVLTGYFNRACSCFFVVGRWPEKHNVIALGIELSWFSIFCNSAWAIFYRLSGQQSWMINNDYYTAWSALSAFAATLHIFAPNIMGPALPKLDRIRFGLTGALGFGLICIVGFWRPDLSPYATWLHSLMDEPEWMKRGLIEVWRSGGSILRMKLGL
jgi:hypothetical protein